MEVTTARPPRDEGCRPIGGTVLTGGPLPPLGLPPGSVRAIALLLIAITLCISVLKGIEPPQWMLAIFGAQIGEYVSRRGNGGPPQ